jgi:hypothetical protein
MIANVSNFYLNCTDFQNLFGNPIGGETLFLGEVGLLTSGKDCTFFRKKYPKIPDSVFLKRILMIGTGGLFVSRAGFDV